MHGFTKFLGQVSEIGQAQPCPILKSESISFSENIRKITSKHNAVKLDFY